MYKCQECGRKFRTTKAAQRASNNGCPKCGGVDIDLDTYLGTKATEAEKLVAKTLTSPKEAAPKSGDLGPKSLSNLFRF